jgi:hypothetical protein
MIPQGEIEMIRRMIFRVVAKTMATSLLTSLAAFLIFGLPFAWDCWSSECTNLLSSIVWIMPLAGFCIGVPLWTCYFFSDEDGHLRFYLLFGHWPPKDVLLRKKLQEIVDEKMKLLAVDIRIHNQEESTYQFQVKRGLPYEEAAKELPRVRAIAKLYYGRFKKAGDIAKGVGFKVRDWRDYEGLNKEAFPPADPEAVPEVTPEAVEEQQ